MPQTNFIHNYKEKVEYAVSIVASMSAEQKLEAVQFWNVMSEKLQEIVNHSAADISAISFALEKEKQQMSEYVKDGEGQTYHLLTSTNTSGNTMALIAKCNKAETRTTASKVPAVESTNEIVSEPSANAPCLETLASCDDPQAVKDSDDTEDVDDPEPQTSDNQLPQCDYCEKTFRTVSQLSAHRWKHIKPYICDECGARFGSKTNLQVHSRSHTGEKPYRCELCNLPFSTRGNLKRHNKCHTGSKPYECSHCGQHFTENRSLKVHMRRHTGERPYKCTFCPKAFTQNSILQTHIALHLGEKSHLCDTCGKAFRQKSQLRVHAQRHNNIKKFDCPLCPSQFLTKGDMQRHSRTHTGEKPFACGICKKTFTRQQTLTEHMNRHYGLKPYLCKYCRKGFSEMSACYKHIKTHEKPKKSCTSKITEANEMDSMIIDATLVTIEEPVGTSVIVGQGSMKIHADNIEVANNEMVITGENGEIRGKAVSVLQKVDSAQHQNKPRITVIEDFTLQEQPSPLN